MRQINGGMLVQDRDASLIEKWEVLTKLVFPEQKRALAEFGIKLCKHVKSNAIVIVYEYAPGFYTELGMGAGQPNRIDSTRKLALAKARENMEALRIARGANVGISIFQNEIFGESVMVSDAFFPFPDNVEVAAEAGIRYIVQPGGSKKDQESIEACDRLGVAMAFTHMRHFRH